MQFPMAIANGSGSQKRAKRPRDFYDEKDLLSHSQRLEERIHKYNLQALNSNTDLFGAIATSLFRYAERNERYKLRYYVQLRLDSIPYDALHHIHHIRNNLQILCQEYVANETDLSNNATDLIDGSTSAYIDSSPHGQTVQIIANFLGLEIRLVTSFIYEEIISVKPSDPLEQQPMYIGYNDVTKQYISIDQLASFIQDETRKHSTNLEKLCKSINAVMKPRTYYGISLFGAAAYCMKGVLARNPLMKNYILSSYRNSGRPFEEELSIHIRDLTYQQLKHNPDYYDSFITEKGTANVRKDCAALIEYNYYRCQLEKAVLHALADSVTCNILLFYSSQETKIPEAIACCQTQFQSNTIFLVKNDLSQHFDEIIGNAGPFSIQQFYQNPVLSEESENFNNSRRTKAGMHSANDKNFIKDNSFMWSENILSNLSINDKESSNIGGRDKSVQEKKNGFKNRMIKKTGKLLNVLKLRDNGPDPDTKKTAELPEEVKPLGHESGFFDLSNSMPMSFANDNYQGPSFVLLSPKTEKIKEIKIEQSCNLTNSQAPSYSNNHEEMFQKELNYTLSNLDKYLDVDEKKIKSNNSSNEKRFGTVTLETVEDSEDEVVGEHVIDDGRILAPANDNQKNTGNRKSESFKEATNINIETETAKYKTSASNVSKQLSENGAHGPVKNSRLNSIPEETLIELLAQKLSKQDRSIMMRAMKHAELSTSEEERALYLIDEYVYKPRKLKQEKGASTLTLLENLEKVNCDLLEIQDEGIGCFSAIARSIIIFCQSNRDFNHYIEQRLHLDVLHEPFDRTVRRLHRLCYREWKRNRDRYLGYLSNIDYDKEIEKFRETGHCSPQLENAIPLSIANTLGIEIQIITSLKEYPVLQITPNVIMRKDVMLLLAFDQCQNGRYNVAVSKNLNAKRGKSVTFSDIPEVRTFERSDAEKAEILEWQIERSKMKRDKPNNQPIQITQQSIDLHSIFPNNVVSFQQMNFLPYGGFVPQRINVPFVTVIQPHMLSNTFA